jgi:hypothetical protein
VLVWALIHQRVTPIERYGLQEHEVSVFSQPCITMANLHIALAAHAIKVWIPEKEAVNESAG